MPSNPNLRILIANDDGIHAKGIKILTEAAKSITDDVWVIAPEVEQSGMGHALTYRDPIIVKHYDEKRISAYGTPADCIIVALRGILKDHPPDLILSGINCGENLGLLVTQSGTVGAAMQGSMHHIPSAAISLQTIKGNGVNWHHAQSCINDILLRLLSTDIPATTFLNVNIPENLSIDSKIVYTHQSTKIEHSDLSKLTTPQEQDCYWVGPLKYCHDNQDKGSDTDLLNQGHITFTPLNLDLTDHDQLNFLREQESKKTLKKVV